MFVLGSTGADTVTLTAATAGASGSVSFGTGLNPVYFNETVEVVTYRSEGGDDAVSLLTPSTTTTFYVSGNVPGYSVSLFVRGTAGNNGGTVTTTTSGWGSFTRAGEGFKTIFFDTGVTELTYTALAGNDTTRFDNTAGSTMRFNYFGGGGTDTLRYRGSLAHVTRNSVETTAPY